MVGIIDYGMGNLLSVYNAIEYLGADAIICKTEKDIDQVDKIIIPGVGSFKNCMTKLNHENLFEVLNEHVLRKAKPTLGICLGMQIMASKGFEGGEILGFGWFDAEVIKLHPSTEDLRVPNIGWNEVEHQNGNFLFDKIPQKADLYLVHSYYVKCSNENDVIASYNYNHKVTAAIMKDNIVGTQFHPEKSQDYGLKILDNFINWKP